jgi:hypothetical protein|tara:strand:+ start:1567 stop:1686 length:120 start_codon:yes stop_codon:yes gene_type:complete
MFFDIEESRELIDIWRDWKLCLARRVDYVGGMPIKYLLQ